MTKSQPILEDEKTLVQSENKLAPTTKNKALETVEVIFIRDTFHKGVMRIAGSSIVINKSELKDFSGLVRCKQGACEVCK